MAAGIYRQNIMFLNIVEYGIKLIVWMHIFRIYHFSNHYTKHVCLGPLKRPGAAENKMVVGM